MTTKTTPTRPTAAHAANAVRAIVDNLAPTATIHDLDDQILTVLDLAPTDLPPRAHKTYNLKRAQLEQAAEMRGDHTPTTEEPTITNPAATSDTPEEASALDQDALTEEPIVDTDDTRTAVAPAAPTDDLDARILAQAQALATNRANQPTPTPTPNRATARAERHLAAIYHYDHNWAHITKDSTTAERHTAMHAMHATGLYTLREIADLLGYASQQSVSGILRYQPKPTRPKTKPAAYHRAIHTYLHEGDAIAHVLAKAFNIDQATVEADIEAAK